MDKTFVILNEYDTKTNSQDSIYYGKHILHVLCSMAFGKGTDTPLPNTIQEQLDEGIGHGFDGMIVCLCRSSWSTTSVFYFRLAQSRIQDPSQTSRTI